MDKTLYAINVLLISVCALAYAVHWSFGVIMSAVIAAAICDNRETVKGGRA